MQRRGFLGLLGAFAAGAVLDPERALWVRGAKTISIAAPSRNVIIDPGLYARMALVTLSNNLMLARAINREYGEIFMGPTRLKIGDTIEVRRPILFSPPFYKSALPPL